MRHLRSSLPLFFIVTTTMLCGVTKDIAEAQAYSWVDSEGNTVYGSRPPRGVSAKPLKTRGLSRYSSSKVLERTQHSVKRAPAVDTDTSRAKLSRNGSETTIKAGAKSNAEQGVAEWNFVAATLHAESPSIRFNSAMEVTACGAFVRNDNDYSAAEVSVAFEFPDGTLIPAIGPSTLAANSSAEFSIDDAFLPLLIENATKETKPTVIVHGYQR